MTAEYAKTFYLGTKLMTPEKARAVWAIYVWCRRTDELVDGPNASHITPEVRRVDVVLALPTVLRRGGHDATDRVPRDQRLADAVKDSLSPLSCTGWSTVLAVQALDRWEDRLEALFEGRPYDVLDAALTDTVSRYPVRRCS